MTKGQLKITDLSIPLYAFKQRWALAHLSAQLLYFLGAQVGSLYSDFG